MAIEDIFGKSEVLVPQTIPMAADTIGKIHEELRIKAAVEKTPILAFSKWAEQAVALGRNQINETDENYCRDNGVGVAKVQRGGNAYWHEPGDMSFYLFMPPTQDVGAPKRMYNWHAESLKHVLNKLGIRNFDVYHRWAYLRPGLENAHDGLDIRINGKVAGVVAVDNSDTTTNVPQGFCCLRLKKPDVGKMLGAMQGYNPDMTEEAAKNIGYINKPFDEIQRAFLDILGNRYREFRFENGTKASYDFSKGYLIGGLLGIEHLRDNSADAGNSIKWIRSEKYEVAA